MTGSSRNLYSFFCKRRWSSHHLQACVEFNQSDSINKKFQQFKTEREKLVPDGKFKKNLLGLEAKYNYKKETTVQIKNNFIDSVDKVGNFKYHAHPTLDIAILIFEGFSQKAYSSYATFVKDPEKVKQGK